MDITLAEGLCAAGLLVASVTDLREQKIYNWLTFPMIALGIAYNSTLGQGWAFALTGLAAATVLHVFLWVVKVERAGDPNFGNN